MRWAGKLEAAFKKHELITRVITALVLVPLALYFIYAGGYIFKGFLVIVALLLGHEYECLTHLPKKSRGIFTAGVFATIFWLLTTNDALALVHGAFMAGVVGFVVFEIGVILNKTQMKWAGGGIAYICIPIFSLGVIQMLDGTPYWVFWLLAVVWACDTGAFAFGKIIGGPRFAPRISPNKTWAGFAGGVVFGAGAGAIAAYFFGLGDPLILAFLASLLSIWAQIGDLVESFIKRKFKTKDSGNLIPGHGGVLDRMDALMFAAPVVALALWLMA
ncbi:MAG: CDP-archaeol synthase [Sphingomonadales bacterium]